MSKLNACVLHADDVVKSFVKCIFLLCCMVYLNDFLIEAVGCDTLRSRKFATLFQYMLLYLNIFLKIVNCDLLIIFC